LSAGNLCNSLTAAADRSTIGCFLSPYPCHGRTLMNAIRSYVAALALLDFLAAPLTFSADWPQLGRDNTRNAVSPEKGAPLHWQIEERDRAGNAPTLGGQVHCSPTACFRACPTLISDSLPNERGPLYPAQLVNLPATMDAYDSLPARAAGFRSFHMREGV
jgi:hypothetical protein